MLTWTLKSSSNVTTLGVSVMLPPSSGSTGMVILNAPVGEAYTRPSTVPWRAARSGSAANARDEVKRRVAKKKRNMGLGWSVTRNRLGGAFKSTLAKGGKPHPPVHG